MWDNSESQIKLNHAKCIDKDSLSRDSAFNVAAQGIRNGCHSFIGWLPETWTKMWPTVSKQEMPNLLWFNAEGIQSLKEDWDFGVDLPFKTYSSTLGGPRKQLPPVL